MAGSKRPVKSAGQERPDNETLLRLLAFNAGIVDQQGYLLPMWERRLQPVEGHAYTASSVLVRDEPEREDNPDVDPVAQLEAEMALRDAGLTSERQE